MMKTYTVTIEIESRYPENVRRLFSPIVARENVISCGITPEDEKWLAKTNYNKYDDSFELWLSKNGGNTWDIYHSSKCKREKNQNNAEYININLLKAIREAIYFGYTLIK